MNIKFELNRAGVAQLMKSEEIQQMLKGQATAIKNRCGEGYESDTHVGRNRANAMVFANTPKAINSNLKNNTILKALK